MKSLHLFLCLSVLLDYSCGKPVVQDTDAGSGVSIVKEYHENGLLKTEISVAGNLRQGLTKNYNSQGKLISEVNYVNNLKEGMATNYYVATGKVNSTLVYKHGVKEGDEIWYYENGKPYRVSPYVKGVIEGVQKLYHENGQVMAEVTYKNGFPGTGLKEYAKNGTLISDYPKITISREDHLKDANKIVLIISLSNNNENVKFYKGSLNDGKYLQKGLLLLATQKGKTQVDYNIPPGARFNQIVVISANYKTPMGNPYIISRTYNLEAFNP